MFILSLILFFFINWTGTTENIKRKHLLGEKNDNSLNYLVASLCIKKEYYGKGSLLCGKYYNNLRIWDLPGSTALKMQTHCELTHRFLASTDASLNSTMQTITYQEDAEEPDPSLGQSSFMMYWGDMEICLVIWPIKIWKPFVSLWREHVISAHDAMRVY